MHRRNWSARGRTTGSFLLSTWLFPWSVGFAIVWLWQGRIESLESLLLNASCLWRSGISISTLEYRWVMQSPNTRNKARKQVHRDEGGKGREYECITRHQTTKLRLLQTCVTVDNKKTQETERVDSNALQSLAWLRSSVVLDRLTGTRRSLHFAVSPRIVNHPISQIDIITTPWIHTSQNIIPGPRPRKGSMQFILAHLQ